MLSVLPEIECNALSLCHLGIFSFPINDHLHCLAHSCHSFRFFFKVFYSCPYFGVPDIPIVITAEILHQRADLIQITELADKATYAEASVYGATIRSEVGKPVNMFYGYKTQGVFATSEEAANAGLYQMAENGVDKEFFKAGDMHFVDQNGDHQIDDKDRVFIGDPNPDIYGNIFTTMAYKSFRLDVNFNYSLGNDVYNYMRSQLEGGNRFMNQTTAMTRRWQTEGQITDLPKATFQDPMGNSRFSDRWIEDGSYLRLKTVTLSYKLPMNTRFLQGLEFWVQANNLLTFSKYLGSDPEFSMTSNVIGQGIDLGQLPQSRSFVAGVKINL